MKAIPPRPGFDWSRDERAEQQGIILHIDRTY